MKRTIVPIPLKAVEQLEACEFSMELNAPGEIVQAVVQVKQSKIEIAGKPNLEFIPTVMVLIDPDAPKSTRNFIMVPPMKVAESEGKLEYRASLLSPDGRILFIFEEKLDGEVPQQTLILSETSI